MNKIEANHLNSVDDIMSVPFGDDHEDTNLVLSPEKVDWQVTDWMNAEVCLNCEEPRCVHEYGTAVCKILSAANRELRKRIKEP